MPPEVEPSPLIINLTLTLALALALALTLFILLVVIINHPILILTGGMWTWVGPPQGGSLANKARCA